MTALLVTEPPADAVPSAHFVHRFDPSRGSVLIRLSPTDRTVGAAALTLLQALGKNLLITGALAVRNEEHRLYTPVWLEAMDIQTVVVAHAHTLRGDVLRHLRSLMPSSVQNLVLIAEPGRTQRVLSTLSRYPDAHPVVVPWSQVTAEHPKVVPPPTVTEDAYTLEHLPHVDFLLFRDASRRLNTAERFAAIDADYVRVYRDGHEVDPDLRAILDHLVQVSASAYTTAPLLVAVRATQAALFKRGWLLRAHPDKLLGTLSSVRLPRPTDVTWRDLRAYIRPERPATCALHLLGVPATELMTVTLDDVSTTLATGTLKGAPVPSLAQPLLRAQLLRRQTEGATGPDPYLALPGERRHLDILIDARRDLAIPIEGRALIQHDENFQIPTIRRLGLDLQGLT